MRTRHTLAFDPEVTADLKALPGLGATDGNKGDRPAVKLFDAYGQAFWVLWEYNPTTEIAFGLCDLGVGFPEIGYVSIAEVRDLGHRIEKDTAVSTMAEGYKSRRLSVPDYLMETTL